MDGYFVIGTYRFPLWLISPSEHVSAHHKAKPKQSLRVVGITDMDIDIDIDG